VAQRAYQVGGLTFGLRSNSRQFLRWADGVLGDFGVSDDEVDPYYSVLVGGADGHAIGKRFHILYREANAVARSLDLGVVGRALLFDVESLTFSKRDDALYLDAPIVSGHGANVLIPADFASFFNRGGKKLERAGVSMPLSWTTAIDLESGGAAPVRETVPVPPDALDRLRQIAPIGFDGGAGQLAVPPVVDAACFLGFDLDGAIAPAATADAVYRLAKATRNLKVLRRKGFETLADLVERLPCIQLQSAVFEPLLETLVTVMKDVAAPKPRA
jgi:hypothetical protein